MKRISESHRKLIRDLKTELPRYGHERIAAIANSMGIKVSPTTVYNVLSEANLITRRPKTVGIPPSTIIKKEYGFQYHYSERMKAGWRKIKFYGVNPAATFDLELMGYIRDYYRENNSNKIIQVRPIAAKDHSGFIVHSIVVNII